MKPELETFLRDTRHAVNTVLDRWGQRAATSIGGRVGAAVAYSLGGAGKRIRPALAIGVFEALGGAGDVLEIAGALEVIHTYSLVHDDLPCMDNDDLRRGRPTTHRHFDVATATEAGYRMMPLAAQMLSAGAASLGLSDEVLGTMGSELFRAAGASGMVGGQLLDLDAEGAEVSLDALREIHRRKTGTLIQSSAVIGAMAAGASGEHVTAIRQYGAEVGIAFQIADDVLDATATSQQLGKTAGKDREQRKATFATIVGSDIAMAEAHDRVERAIDLLGRNGINSIRLQELATFMINRRS